MGIKKEREKIEQRRKRRSDISRRALMVILILALLFIAIFLVRTVVTSLVRHWQETHTETEELAGETAPQIDTSNVTISQFVISEGPTSEEEDSSSEPVTLTLSFVGDCTLGKDESAVDATSFNAYYDLYGADYFLQNVRGIFSEDDLTTINLESTLTTETDRADKTYAFKGDPAYVSILSDSSVEAANLANNHSKDYGINSYVETKDTLSAANIAFFDAEQVALLTVKGVQIGMVGINALNGIDEAEDTLLPDLTALKEAGAQILIVNFHWGIEKEETPTSEQVSLAHQAIDWGADLVIGHHPHVLQGIETYQGKTIAYSLGNFCFGGNTNPTDKDTVILQQSFTVTGTEVTTDAVQLIPCSLSSVSDHNDYCPTPLTGEEAERVLNKIETLSANQ